MVKLATEYKTIREVLLLDKSTGESVDPSYVFNFFYEPLNGLIEHNSNWLAERSNLTPKKIEKRTELGMRIPGEGKDEETAKELFQEAIGEIRKRSTTIDARIMFDTQDGRVKTATYRVEPRTNFDFTPFKLPSIVYLTPLESQDSRFVIREARSHNTLEPAQLKGMGIYRNKFKKIPLAETSPKDVILLPEPALVLGLEDLYLQQGVKRITPPLKFLGVNQESLWYIRDFADLVRDVHLDPSELMRFLGTLNGLGLMDDIDGNSAHYSFNGSEIVHIDPDFFTYTQTDRNIEHFSWPNTKQDLLDKMGLRVDRDLQGIRREQMERTKIDLGTNTIRSVLPTDIMNAPILSHNQFSTENFVVE
jgi:hypothetical protein